MKMGRPSPLKKKKKLVRLGYTELSIPFSLWVGW